ncbi:MAG: c-type cytochrome [Cypionkella sp.]|uniref:c-type cytochrome n=1 Tax=Cypionkella sp. TaxID=2811411 RepID=UPI002ABA36F2|nr:c-type cytochrome [Cypionkella sp.]MDZ4311656.1 c-type cytochrome [Cypionkella sp.]MDZ4392785.1 c-type cytochrome [Cypionkella sp.]
MKSLSQIATLSAILTAFALPVLAAGDAEKGEDLFKRCKACHSIISPDGAKIQMGGKTGPNLFGVIGRQIGSVPDFKYGSGLTELNAKGMIWDEALLAAYIANPTPWVKEQSGDPAASAKMAFKMASGAEDMAAYLATTK